MNQLLTFLQWLFQGITYFTIGMLYIAVITLFCLVVLGTMKLLYTCIRKLLQK